MDNICKNIVQLEIHKDFLNHFYIYKGKKTSMILGFHKSKKDFKTHQIVGDQDGLF
jgi:hypothetical protein